MSRKGSCLHCLQCNVWPLDAAKSHTLGLYCVQTSTHTTELIESVENCNYTTHKHLAVRCLDLWVTLWLWHGNWIKSTTPQKPWVPFTISQRCSASGSSRQPAWGAGGESAYCSITAKTRDQEASNRGVQQQKTGTKFITWLMSLFRVNLTTVVTKLLLFFYFYFNSKLIPIRTNVFSLVFLFESLAAWSANFTLTYLRKAKSKKNVSKTLHPQKQWGASMSAC